MRRGPSGRGESEDGHAQPAPAGFFFDARRPPLRKGESSFRHTYTDMLPGHRGRRCSGGTGWTQEYSSTSRGHRREKDAQIQPAALGIRAGVWATVATRDRSRQRWRSEIELGFAHAGDSPSGISWSLIDRLYRSV